MTSEVSRETGDH